MAQATVTPKKLQVPWVTLSLITANFVGSAVGLLNEDVALELAFNPARPNVVAALASLFLHANLIHLLGNMLFLAAVGPRVESVAGRLRAALIYLIGGLVGVAAHWVVMRSIGAAEPLLGASGAIASCAGYCAVRFMNRKVPLAPKINVSVGTVTLIWVGLQAVGAFVRFGEGPVGGTAFWTHLAGFAAGLALSVAFKAQRDASLQFGHEILDKMSERGPAALVEAARQHLQAHPGDPKALRELAGALRQMGEDGQAAETLVTLLGVTAPEGRAAVMADLEACDGWRMLPSLSRLKMAEEFREAQPALSVRLLRHLVADTDAEALRPDALLALAEVEDEDHRGAVLSQLQEQYTLHPAAETARRKGLLH